MAGDADLPTLRASAMRRLGMTDFLVGRLGQASSRLAAAYQVSLAAGDRRGQAWSLQNLAWVTTTRATSPARMRCSVGPPASSPS